MSIFGRRNTLSLATASTGEHDDRGAIGNEINRLEDHLADDPAATAAAALEGFELTPGARSLLDRAVDNLSQQNANGFDADPEFKQVVAQRAELLSACGSDLNVAIGCLVDACSEDPKAIAGMVYSLCYNALKGAVFFANLDYRRYLDPRGDFDLTPYMKARVEDEALGTEFESDARSEQREPPAGIESSIDREIAYFSSIYGSSVVLTEDVFAAALSDLRTFLSLTAEAFGWDPDRPMPFTNIAEANGSFTPITDPQVALDNAELRRKESRRKRAVADAERMAAAAARARAMLSKSLGKTAAA